MRNEYPNFTGSEFDSPDKPDSGAMYMRDKFLIMLQEMREIAKVPFVITSGYRTEAHNKKVKGKPNSAHLRGFACDIAIHGSSNRYCVIRAAILAGFTRIGIGNGLVHVDCDPNLPGEVSWVY